jgi:hypothetical protein
MKHSSAGCPPRNILFRLTPELNSQIEEIRQSQPVPPTRSALMRELLRVALAYYPLIQRARGPARPGGS